MKYLCTNRVLAFTSIQSTHSCFKVILYSKPFMGLIPRCPVTLLFASHSKVHCSAWRPSSFQSDNGTNVVEAARELREFASSLEGDEKNSRSLFTRNYQSKISNEFLLVQTSRRVKKASLNYSSLELMKATVDYYTNPDPIEILHS